MNAETNSSHQTNYQIEFTPLRKDDLFVVLDHRDAKFDYPPHFHADFEINMVLDAAGTRQIGDSFEPFGRIDIILVGPNVPHIWKGYSVEGCENHVVTIQFQRRMLDYEIFDKRIFLPIRTLLRRASQGVSFSESACAPQIRDKIIALTRARQFDSVLGFFSLLDSMADCSDARLLASQQYSPFNIGLECRSRRINRVCEYIGRNYACEIREEEVAALINMSVSAFSRFFRKRTGKCFIDYLNEFRVGQASQMLCETTDSVAEICFRCGFNNTSHFTKVFRKKRGTTPTVYRATSRQIWVKV